MFANLNTQLSTFQVHISILDKPEKTNNLLNNIDIYKIPETIDQPKNSGLTTNLRTKNRISYHQN